MPANHVTQRYLDECATDVPLRVARSAARNAPAFVEAYGSIFLPRPLFVEESAIRGAADDAVAVFDLIISLPDRLFDGDRVRFCTAMGMDERATQLTLLGASGHPPRYGRVDMIDDGSSFKLIEANIGSELGGLDLGEASRALLQVDAFRAFAQRHNLSYIDTCEELIALFRRVAGPVAAGRDPVIAVLEWTGGFETLPALYRSFQEAMAARHIEVHLAEVQQVVNRDGKLYFNDRPIDIALRYLGLPQVRADPQAEEILEPVLRAHQAGGTILFTQLETSMFANKATLAFLSDTRHRHAFSASDAALIDRVVPWTRILEGGRTEVDGQSVDMMGYCLANREELIIKPCIGFGGYGTVAGRDVTAEEWEKLLAEKNAGDHIVQRRVVAQVEQVVNPQTGELEDWLPVWGLFFTDHGYAGEWIRARRAGSGSVVSFGTSAGIASAFYYPTGAPTS